MSVVLAMEEVGPCRKRLKIEVPGPAVAAESARVVGDLAKKVRVPGFRKGKVPAGLVKRQFPDEVYRETIERIVPRYWRQAAAEKGLDPLGPPQVADVHLHEGEPMTFTAVVEVRPEFELRNYKDFALPAPGTEPTDQEIDSTLEDLRKGSAEWVATTRPAAVGDRAKIELKETTPSSADEPAHEPQTATVEVGSPRVWDELNLALTGLSVGQSASFTHREGEGDEARERSFELRLAELEEPRLPALDDELAKKIGKFETLEALRTAVAARLLAGRREEADAERQRVMLDQLTERHPMPLPDGVVKSEIEELLREYAEGLARRGIDIERAEIDWQKVGEEARPHAERRVKARLLLDAIAEREAIAVSEAEFEQALAVLARVQGVASGALRQRLDSDGELSGLRGRMRREKTVRYLLGESAGAEPGTASDGTGAEAPEGVK
jgi:trigger factor